MTDAPSGDAIVPKGRLVTVAFTLTLPETATRDQIMEWIEFELGRGSIDEDNPLIEHGLEADFEPVLTETPAYRSMAVVRTGERSYATAATVRHDDRSPSESALWEDASALSRRAMDGPGGGLPLGGAITTEAVMGRPEDPILARRIEEIAALPR